MKTYLPDWVIPAFAYFLPLALSSAVPARNPNGTYVFKHVSGATYREGERLKFPPEGIIAAAMGKNIVVRHKRIRFNRRAKEDIVEEMRRDYELHDVLSFQLKSAPRFGRFKKSADGIYRAESSVPFVISLRFSFDDAPSAYSSTWANYTAEIQGKRMIVSVRFQGKTGPYWQWDGDQINDAQVKGGARLVARLKPTPDAED